MTVALLFSLFLTVLMTSDALCQKTFDPEKWVREMEEAYSSIDSYTTIFHKQERVDGRLLDEETVFLKFKKPFSVYMKWVKPPYQGRELIYVVGGNNNQMTAHEGGIMGVVTMNLNPRGALAMRGNRHPVMDTGIGHLIDTVAKNIRKAIRSNELRVVEHGMEVVYGCRTLKTGVAFARNEEQDYYGYRIAVNVDIEKKVPIKIQIYDWNDQLVESYGYENLKLNAGLTAVDFDPRNREYRF